MDKLGSGYQPIAIWIRDEKYLLSQRLGYDVGVPAIVDNLIARAYSLRELGFVPDDSPSRQMDNILLTDAKRDGIASRETWISTYLFNGLYESDEHGANHLEGELKRFAAKRDGIPVEQVVFNSRIVKEYVEAHKLSKGFQNYACRRLGLQELSCGTPA